MQATATERERRLTASDGVELAYWLRRGEARRRLLVLLHGGASNHTRWSELLEESALGESWDTLRPDLRGNGASMTRGRLDLALWCRDLAEILAAEGYPAALVLGHSLGAQIAVHFAARRPGQTLGLALIDPLVTEALRGRRRRLYRMRLLVRAAAWLIRGLNALGLRRSTFPEQHRDLHRLDEETREALRGPESLEEIARRYSALGPILRAMPTANYLQQLLATAAPLPDLATIDRPVLVLLSAGITFADPEASRRELARLPRGEIVEVAANHWPLTESPAEVRRALGGWLEKTFPGESVR